MVFLKKVFPLSFKKMSSAADLIVGILIYIVAAVVAGVAIWVATAIVGWIPAIGGLLAGIIGAVGGLIGLYSLVGIILQILVYCKVLNDKSRIKIKKS